MATIDKSLPNTKTEFEIPAEEEIVESQQEIIERQQGGEPEITMDEEGGATVEFDPAKINPEGGLDHFENLADFLEDNVLDPLASELMEKYTNYKESRQEWADSYREGLNLLGFKYVTRTEPFRGASSVTHPVLAEAVTQSQAQAYKELLPADGPVRTQIMGDANVAKEEQSKRVKDFMNYQIMDQMKEYEPEFDQMLFYLPLSGSTFKKVYYDDLLGRAVSKFIPAEDLVVPYSATSLEDAEAVIHVIRMSPNDLRKQQINGFYRDIDLGEPPIQEDQLKQKELELEGVTSNGTEDVYTILEMHVDVDLEGHEDVDPTDQEPTGIKLPYIITIDEANGKVLSIRRNYGEQDPLRKKKDYFVHFKFLPGLGFYGLGLIHMIGGLSRTATSALRSLLDAGTLSNLPAGFKMRGIKMRDEAQAIQPGEFRDVDAPGGNLRDAFMTLPFKEPSQTLLSLMGVVVQAGQRFASIADLQVGDGNQQAAVGTTVAMLERGSRTMSAIHKRLYASMKKEFSLLGRVFKLYLPPIYPYDIIGGQRQIKQLDFDDRVDILPVADPNIFSQTQRISLAQTEMQLASSNPQLHNQYQVYRNMYEALGVKDIDSILIRPQPPTPKDPALEHIDALGGKPFQAFPGQDHRSHITAHLNFLETNMVKNAPVVGAAIQKNILEHISLMAQEQIELEFREELPQLAQMMQMAQQNPQMQQQAMAMQQRIDARKAVLISEMMEEYSKEEKSITSQFGNDPIAMLRARELDLQAQENARKKQEGEQRLNLDRMKTMMNQQNVDEKLDQNEELAQLRSDTSIEKTILSNQLKKDK